MRKIFLLFAALTMAVAANAFDLTLYHMVSGSPEFVSVTSAVDNDDVLGDGTVSVAFDATNRKVTVTLDNATIKTTNASVPFSFVGDANYNFLTVIVKGNCTIDAGQYGANVIRIDEAVARFESDAATDYLLIQGGAVIMQIHNSTVHLGNSAKEAFNIQIVNTNDGVPNQSIFYGSGTSSSLIFEYANVSADAYGENQTTLGLTSVGFSCGQKIIGSDGVGGTVDLVLDETDYTLKYSGNAWKGGVQIIAPYPINVGPVWMFPGDENNFHPAQLTSGTITYDKVNKKLTLNAVVIRGWLVTNIDGITVYLKGSNTIYNATTPVGNARIYFGGKDCVLSGDADADLSLSCGGSSSGGYGIYVGQNLEISGFKSLQCGAAAYGIQGADLSEASNNLNIGLPVTIYSAYNAIKGFDAVNITDGNLQITTPSAGATWSVTNKQYENNNDNTVVSQLTINYPSYNIQLYGADINAGNAADIKVTGVTATGKASYNPETHTLTLNNYVADGDTWAAITPNNNELIISLVGDNELHCTTFGISTEANLTITGPGTLTVTASLNDGLVVPPTGTLTINNSATVIVSGVGYGVKTDATLTCNMGMGSEYELENSGGTLIVNNATLKATGAADGSIVGFTTFTPTGAELTTPSAAQFFAGCDWSTGIGGVVTGNSTDGYTYVKDQVIIAKTGASGIENTLLQNVKGEKTIIDGQLFIICGEHMYNAQGAEVR